MPDHKVYRDENGDYLIRASGLNDFFIHTVDDAEPPQPSPSASSPPPTPTATPVAVTPTPSTSSPPFMGIYDAGYYCIGSPTDTEGFCRPGECTYHPGGGIYGWCETILGPYATEAECNSACSGGETATPTTTPTTTSTPTPT